MFRRVPSARVAEKGKPAETASANNGRDNKVEKSGVCMAFTVVSTVRTEYHSIEWRQAFIGAKHSLKSF